VVQLLSQIISPFGANEPNQYNGAQEDYAHITAPCWEAQFWKTKYCRVQTYSSK
jgi:hypothetical protein